MSLINYQNNNFVKSVTINRGPKLVLSTRRFGSKSLDEKLPSDNETFWGGKKNPDTSTTKQDKKQTSWPINEKKSYLLFWKRKKKRKKKQNNNNDNNKTKQQQQQVIMPESIFINTLIQIQFFSSFSSIFLLSYIAFIFLFNALFFFC